MLNSPIHTSLPPDGKLRVPHGSFDEARRSFGDEAIALKAWVRSEAIRLANALVRPLRAEATAADLVGTICDLDAIRIAGLRSRRYDFAIKLVRSARFKAAVTKRAAIGGAA